MYRNMLYISTKRIGWISLLIVMYMFAITLEQNGIFIFIANIQQDVDNKFQDQNNKKILTQYCLPIQAIVVKF